jgi:hypothetical protein
MADVGKIHKTFEMYIDKETATEAIVKGDLVCWETGASTSRIKKTDTSLDNQPPYGVALEDMTAAAETGLVAWRGVVEVEHDITNDDTLYKNQPVMVSPTTSGAVEKWETTDAEYHYVGHTLEACASTTAEVKIMLAGW